MKPTKPHIPTFWPTLWLVLLGVLLSGCTLIEPVAERDSAVLARVEQVYLDADAFYTALLKAPPEEREYAVFEEQYLAIESELRGLVFMNKARERGPEAIKMAENVLELWGLQKNDFEQRYQTERSLSDRIIELNRLNMSDALLAIIRAEKARPKS